MASMPSFSLGASPATAGAGATATAATATAAGTAGSFSFGAAATASAPAEKNDTPSLPKLKPSATIGKLSETAPDAATASTTAAAFSFGASTPAAPPGTSPAAGALAASVPAFSLGTSTPTTATGAATASTPAKDAAPAPAPVRPSETAGRTAEEIIALWTTELEDQALRFARQASTLARWDRHILQNRAVLVKLDNEVSRVEKAQNALDRQLAILETHERDIHNALVAMDAQVDAMYESEQGRVLGGDVGPMQSRDDIYNRAEAVSSSLRCVGDDLRMIITRINESAAARDASSCPAAAMAVQIMNNQVSALSWVDKQVDALEKGLSQIAMPPT